MKRIVIFMVLVVVLIVSARGCENNNFNNSNLQEIFEKFIIDSCEIDSAVLHDNKKQPIIVDFYEIGKKPYVRVIDFIGISLEKLKGYQEYENYIILYYGVEDSLTNRYLKIVPSNVKKLKQEYYDLDRFDIHIDLTETQIRYYEIKNDTIFERFKPNEFHLDKFKELLINAGIIRLPPPIP